MTSVAASGATALHLLQSATSNAARTSSPADTVAEITQASLVSPASGPAGKQAATVIANAFLSARNQASAEPRAIDLDALRATLEQVRQRMAEQGLRVDNHSAGTEVKGLRNQMMAYNEALDERDQLKPFFDWAANGGVNEVTFGKKFTREGDVLTEVVTGVEGMNISRMRAIGRNEEADRLEALFNEGVKVNQEKLDAVQAVIDKVPDALAEIQERMEEAYDVRGTMFVQGADGRYQWGTFEVRDKQTGALQLRVEAGGSAYDAESGVSYSLRFEE
ncbi:hypothetical protein ABLE91_16485 [Aquabacter sp. CN5-332]|uniref:hypothetical protein n=1 Tax=Aquabacter sp. CN5-332 TaxID=3156608 RepID=UPI0032B5717F